MAGEVHILKGFDAIVNQDNVKPGVDLKALERQMISGGIVTQAAKERDPSDKLNDALNRAAKKLGINFDDVSGKSAAKPVQSVQTSHMSEGKYNTQQSVQSRQEASPFARSYVPDARTHVPDAKSYKVSTPQRNDRDENHNQNDSHDERDDSQDDRDDKDDNSDHGDYQPEETPPNTFARTQSGQYGQSVQSSQYGQSGQYGQSNLLSRTLEQERRTHIDSVVGPEGNTDFSLEKEKREDLKCSMLAEIDSLLTSLSMEEINLERIPTVTTKSSYEEVETTLKILRHKNDQTRCCTFAEEGLMFAAYALEDLFDGKNVWFGRWSPDLTGYHNQMNVKLRRVRYDTGQIVGAIMEDYNIGPGVRIGLEIIPNMFLYSKMRKQQHSQPSLGSGDDADIERANTNLRNL